MTELVYEEPQPITEREVFDAIERNDIERLIMIPIELGFHHENWKFTQDIAVRLSEHPDPRVRRNSLFGIEYAVRFRGRVEKNVVKPVLLRALRDPNPVVADQAADVIAAINLLMKWSIGGAKHQKQIEAAFEERRESEEA